MITGKVIVLTIWTFVSKVMSLLFDMLSRFVITFFQGALNFLAAVTICNAFGAQENKVSSCFHCLPNGIQLCSSCFTLIVLQCSLFYCVNDDIFQALGDWPDLQGLKRIVRLTPYLMYSATHLTGNWYTQK